MRSITCPTPPPQLGSRTAGRAHRPWSSPSSSWLDGAGVFLCLTDEPVSGRDHSANGSAGLSGCREKAGSSFCTNTTGHTFCWYLLLTKTGPVSNNSAALTPMRWRRNFPRGAAGGVKSSSDEVTCYFFCSTVTHHRGTEHDQLTDAWKSNLWLTSPSLRKTRACRWDSKVQ